MRAILISITLLLALQGCSVNSKIPFLNTFSLQTKAEKEAAIKDCVTCEEDTTEFDDEFAEEDEELLDPLREYNALVTSFNDRSITHVVTPVTKVYNSLLSEPIRTALSNVLHHVRYPIRVSNNLLQGKFQNASEETQRFIINSTLGFAGLTDIATDAMNIPRHNEDFGQTLGHYGVGAGFHVVLPFVGPSNIRDIIGLIADGYISPLVYTDGLEKYKLPHNYEESFGAYLFRSLNTNSLQVGAYESLKQDALELYPFLRDIYEQKRDADILK